MKWPQHRSPTVDQRRATAPYNFVRLPEAVLAAPDGPFCKNDIWLSERHHGTIHISITTETETYTRAAYPPNKEQGPEFYHLGNPSVPVIPGSSLRGMVRSLVEILTYARLSRKSERGLVRVLDKKLVYRAVANQGTASGDEYARMFLGDRGGKGFDYPHPDVQAGYLERDSTTGGWGIRPAQRLPSGPTACSFSRILLDDLRRLNIPARDNTAHQSVWFSPDGIRCHPSSRKTTRDGRPIPSVNLYYARATDVAREPGPGRVQGRLVCSGVIGTRHMHTAVHPPDKSLQIVPIPPVLWAEYVEDRDLQRGLPCRKLASDGDPLFYLRDSSGALRFFGPTLFFRIPYANATGEFLPGGVSNAEEAPLDIAEAIFGTVNGSKKDNRPSTGSHRGRVRFGDSVFGSTLDHQGATIGNRWLGILSSPKPTSYQHYLVQDRPDNSRDLRSYSATPLEATVLRGFKRYWHRGSPGVSEISDGRPTQSTDQHTLVCPVRAGTVFNGAIHFENLTSLELGVLLAALELPPTCRHQIGMGKPLGMGAVKIESRIELFDMVRRCASFSDPGVLEVDQTSTILSEARRVFRQTILSHYNKTAKPNVDVGKSFWDIPRLAELRWLLEWNDKLPRIQTRYMDKEAGKFRRVLPSPSALRGQGDSLVTADLPTDEVKASTPVASTEVLVVLQPGSTVRHGVVTGLSKTEVTLRLDGETRKRTEAIDKRFSGKSWSELATIFHPGCRIGAELSVDGKILRVFREHNSA